MSLVRAQMYTLPCHANYAKGRMSLINLKLHLLLYLVAVKYLDTQMDKLKDYDVLQIYVFL